jgi:hypothetical protein
VSLVFQLLYANSGSFAAGTTPDHIVCTLTGPQNATQTVGANSTTVTFPGTFAAGTYSLTLQSQDASNNNLGNPVTITANYTPVVPGPLPLPVNAKLVGGTTS